MNVFSFALGSAGRRARLAGSLRGWVGPDGGVDPFVAGRSPSSKPVGGRHLLG